MTRERQAAGIERSEAEETPRLILRAARQLFLKHGYRAVTTRQVADACGLTQPALYHHFEGKEELYVAMLQDEIARMRGGVERITGRAEPVPERLRRAALFLLTTTDFDFALMQHDMRSELSAAHQEVLSDAFIGGVVGPLAALFAEGQRDGGLRDPESGGVDPMSAAFLFLTLVAHFLMAPPPGAGPARPGNTGEAAGLIVRLLLHGLAAPRAGSG